jgi:hypothetical protein
MPSRAEAQAERSDAAADIREDGAPVLLRFDKNWAVTSSRTKPAPDWIDVQTWILFAKASVHAASGVLVGDLDIYMADDGLETLEGLADLPLGGKPVRTGYVVLVGSPETHPAPTDVGVRTLHLLRIVDTTKVGGWNVLHRIHARG